MSSFDDDNNNNNTVVMDDSNNDVDVDVELSQMERYQDKKNDDRFVDEETPETTSKSNGINFGSGPSSSLSSSSSSSSKSLSRSFLLGLGLMLVVVILVSVLSDGSGRQTTQQESDDHDDDDDSNNNANNNANNGGWRTYDIDPNDPCEVVNANGNDVTSEVYNPHLRLVNCTGTRKCEGFVGNKCQHLLCDGVESCYHTKFYDVSGQIKCLNKHACHENEIHAIPDSKEPTNIDCLGNSACDVTIMTNMNNLKCQGPDSCRKVRAHAKRVLCDKGGVSYNACDASATFVIEECLICTSEHSCGHAYNQCRYRQLDLEGEEKIPVDYFTNTNYMTVDKWTKCKPNSIVEYDNDNNTGGQCLQEWKEIYEEENIEDTIAGGGTDTENGG